MKGKLKKANRRALDAERAAGRVAREAEAAIAAAEKIQAKPAVEVPIFLQGFTPVTGDLDNTKVIPTAPPVALPALPAPAEVKFMPSPQHRQHVYDMATWGLNEDDMARRIINDQTGRPISTHMLRSRFADELAQGRASAKTEIAKVAFLGATGYPAVYDDQGNLLRAERPPNPALVIWATKTRLGWTEKKNVDITHKSGDDPEVMETLKTLSPDELRTIRDFSRRRALEKPAAAQSDDRQDAVRDQS